MTDPRPATPKSALTRPALERVLARAAELQAASGDGDDAGAMTEEQLVELGKEVGLSGDLLRQALAEERSRTLVPAESGWLASFMGASSVSAARTVPGSSTATLAAIDLWMQRSEGLQVKRQFTDQVVWEARRDFFSVFRRALTISGSGLELAAADSVSAIVSGVAAGKSHVRIVADYAADRRQRATNALVLTAFIVVLITGPLLAIGIGPLLSAIPSSIAAIATLFFSRRKYEHIIERAQVALEQTLDRLEFAETKPPTTAQVLLDAFIGTPKPPK